MIEIGPNILINEKVALLLVFLLLVFLILGSPFLPLIGRG